MIRKFFDIAIESAPGQPIVSADIAGHMARAGIRTETGVPAQVPDVKIESTPAAPAAVQQPAEPVKTETATPAATAPEPAVPAAPLQPEPSPAQPVPAKAEPPAPIDWKQVLKDKNPDSLEVLKELGFDDKMTGFLHTWKTGGDLTQYLMAATMDFSKMSDLDVMKFNIQKEYGSISREDQELLFQMRVIEQYKLDPASNTDEDIKRGKVLLNADAMKVRQGLTADQQKYILDSKPPTPQPSTQALDQERELQAAKAQFADYKNKLENDQFTKNLMTTKMFPFGEGDEQFKYESSDPQKYLNMIYDQDAWRSAVTNADGTPNIRKQLQIAMLAADDNFFQLYAKHHQQIGAKKAIAPIENASVANPGGPSSPELPSDPAAALAKAGKMTWG